MRNLARNLLAAVCRYPGPDGRWWQVLDNVGKEGDWPENSCTSLFVAAICKACRPKAFRTRPIWKRGNKEYEES